MVIIIMMSSFFFEDFSRYLEGNKIAMVNIKKSNKLKLVRRLYQIGTTVQNYFHLNKTDCRDHTEKV